MTSMQVLLEEALAAHAISFDPQRIEQLAAYLGLLAEWNRVFNLTRITKPIDMVRLHIVDSLLVLPFLRGSHHLDVGSGAGLPGIPLALFKPEDQFTLLDKNSKKTRFLMQVITTLKLKNVMVEHKSCENFQPMLCFDTILSRALGSLGEFICMSAHLLAPNGRIIAMKGKHPTLELIAVPEQFHVSEVAQLTIKGAARTRHIICIERVRGNERGY